LADLIWLYLTRAANPMSGSHEDQGLPELLTSCSAVAWTVAVTAEEKIEVFLLSRELGLARNWALPSLSTLVCFHETGHPLIIYCAIDRCRLRCCGR
jgi:hypothetical protein